MSRRNDMPTRASRHRISKVPRRELARRFLLDRLLAAVSRRNERSGLPKLAALPGDHIGRTIAIQGLYERDLLEALCNSVLKRALPDAGQCRALDVGANIGNHSIYLARYFRDVVAFEPNPPVAAICKANILLNALGERVRLVECGLSDAAGQLPFTTTPDNLGGSRFTDASVPGAVLRPVERGDDLLAALGGAEMRIGFIKLDVEGFERAALEGLRQTIAKHRPLIAFESHLPEQTDHIHRVLVAAGYPWFYALESRRPGGTRNWRERLSGLLTGDSIDIAGVAAFESRYYPMIIASTVPCLDGEQRER